VRVLKQLFTFLMFKEKILAQLVIKFPGVSKKFLGLWADKLQTKVTEESQIQGVIDALDNLPVPITELATEFQKEGDVRVTEAKKKWEKENPPKPGPKTDPEPPKDDDLPADTPAYVKTMYEQNKKLAQMVEGLVKKDTHQTISQKVSAHEKIKGISASFWNKRALPESEEGIEAFAEDVAKDYQTFVQEAKDKGLAIQTPPAGGTGGAASGTQIDPAIKQFAEKQVAAQSKTNGAATAVK
jgi:hypothetical protein